MKQLPPNNQRPSAKVTVSRLLTRRNLLLLLGGSFAALSTLHWFRQPRVPDTVPAEHSQAFDAPHRDFLALSTLLTSRQALSYQTSVRIYSALSAQDAEFKRHAAALFQFAQQQQLTNPEAIIKALTPELASLKTVLHQIIEAWYLGLVGDQLVAYETALMFEPVRDALEVPSYCSAAPGYWAIQPTVAKV